jgi:hypothetical protein
MADLDRADSEVSIKDYLGSARIRGISWRGFSRGDAALR